MPPFHTAKIWLGLFQKKLAEDDAEGNPEQKVVDLSHGQGRLATPQIVPLHEAARIEPAEQDTGHVGEPVPADLHRTDCDRDRIDHGVGDDEKFHGPRVAKSGRPFTARTGLSRRSRSQPARLASGIGASHSRLK